MSRRKAKTDGSGGAPAGGPSTAAGAFRFLGLAHRAGAVARGTGATRDALRTGRARLVLTATDGAPGQLDKLEGLLRARDVPHRSVGTRAEMGAALGGPPLTSVAVTDAGFAEQVLRRLSQGRQVGRGLDGPGGGVGSPEDAAG